MLYKEELNDKDLENVSKQVAKTSENLNQLNKIKPIGDPDKDLKKFIDLAKQIITDLTISIPKERKESEILRTYFRKYGNTNEAVLNNIRDIPEAKKFFLFI